MATRLSRTCEAMDDDHTPLEICVAVTSGDGVRVGLSRIAALTSEWISQLSEVGGDGSLPGVELDALVVTGRALRLLAVFMEMYANHRDDTISISQPLRDRGDLRNSGTPEWTASWAESIPVDGDLIFEVLEVRHVDCLLLDAAVCPTRCRSRIYVSGIYEWSWLHRIASTSRSCHPPSYPIPYLVRLVGR